MASICFCFGAKPTQRVERRISSETRSGQGKEGPREDRESQLTKEGRREQSAWDTVLSRTQSAEGGSEKMEAGQSRDESAFLVALWRFRANTQLR